jgi:hypothetical protein
MFFRIAAKAHEILRMQYHSYTSKITEQFTSYMLFTEFEKVLEHWRNDDCPTIADFLNRAEMYVALDNTWAARNPSNDKSPCVILTFEVNPRRTVSVEAFMETNLLANALVLCKQSQCIEFDAYISDEGKLAMLTKQLLEPNFVAGEAEPVSAIVESFTINYR